MKSTSLILLAAIALASCGSGGKSAAGQDQAQVDPIGSNPQGCGRFFVGGKSPLIRDAKFTVKSKVLCKRAFAIYHSGVARQPIWVAEALTREQIKLGFGVGRVDNFHADLEIPKDQRSELADYAHSGYDRGHMAPDADMPSREAANDAFALSNMSPQRAGLNRKSWAALEGALRRQTRGGTVYVVTGPLFIGTRIATTHADKRVLVPTSFYKAAYAEDRGATVFVATNDEKPRWTTLTIEQFKQVYGIDPFPGLDPRFRNVNGVLDGSMNRVTGVAGSSGATANSTSGGADCQANGNAVVKNPMSGKAITVEQYRQQFANDPPAEDYCRGASPGAVPAAGGASSAPSGQVAGTQRGTADCQANGPAVVKNPMSGKAMTVEQYRQQFANDPKPEDFCR